MEPSTPATPSLSNPLANPTSAPPSANPAASVPSQSQSHLEPRIPMAESRAIFVRNFELDSAPSDIKHPFSQFGEVVRMELKGYFAFIFMQNDAQAEAAIAALDGKALDETGHRPLKVEWARGDGVVKRREDERRRRATGPSETLFVANFDPALTTIGLLEHHFARFGRIARLDLQARYAFIQYVQGWQATAAKQALNGFLLGDRNIIVEYTIQSGSAPPNRRRYPDHVMGPSIGSRGIMERESYRHGNPLSPRGTYGGGGRMPLDRPSGMPPSYRGERFWGPRDERRGDWMGGRGGMRKVDPSWGEYRGREQMERRRGRELMGRSAHGDVRISRWSRAPYSRRAHRGESKSPQRASKSPRRISRNPRRVSRSPRKISRSLRRESRAAQIVSRSPSPSPSPSPTREREWKRNRSPSRDGEMEKEHKDARDRRQGSKSRSRSPRRRRGARSLSPGTDSNQNPSPIGNRGWSRSPYRKRARSSSSSPGRGCVGL